MMEIDRLYVGECSELLAQLPDKYVDLTITSPPYDNSRKYNGYKFFFGAIAKELYRVTKAGGVVVWIVGDATENGSESGTSFKQALHFKEIGFNLHDTMIYHKEPLPLNHNRYEQEFDYMFVLTKGKPKTFNPIKIPCKWFNREPDKTRQFTASHNEPNKRLRSNKQKSSTQKNKI